MNRLPQTRKNSDSGFVYVVKRGNVYKIGFSRANVKRRVRDAKGELLFTVPTGPRPGILESLIHQRFATKRTSNGGSYTLSDGSVKGREWFRLDAADLDWLRGLSRFMAETV